MRAWRSFDLGWFLVMVYFGIYGVAACMAFRTREETLPVVSNDVYSKEVRGRVLQVRVPAAHFNGVHGERSNT